MRVLDDVALAIECIAILRAVSMNETRRPARGCGQLAGMQQPFVMAHPSGHPPEQWHLACCLGHWLVDRLQYEADRLSCS